MEVQKLVKKEINNALDKRLEYARYETLKLLQEGLSISEIAKYRKVSRQAIYDLLSTLNKKGLINHMKRGRYILTERAYTLFNISKPKNKCLNKEQKIVRVRTEINFSGDIRDLKNFLIDKRDLFMSKPNTEEKRDIARGIRENVFKRDKCKCQKCKSTQNLEIHHIIPFVVGGKNIEENLTVYCTKCHRKTFNNVGKILIRVDNHGKKEVKIRM